MKSSEVHGVGLAAGSRIMSNTMSAYFDLAGQEVFDAKLPEGVVPGNWPAASPVIVKGIGEASTEKLAKIGIKSVADIVTSKTAWGAVLPAAAAKIVFAAEQKLSAAVAKHGVKLPAYTPPAQETPVLSAAFAMDPVSGRSYAC